MNVSNNLTESDFRSLAACFIDRDMVTAAGLRRVDDLEGAEIVGGKRNAATSFAGIVFPYFFPGNVDPREYRLRRDEPDYERNGNGELKEKGKYLSPPRPGNMLYFPPCVSKADLKDTALTCVITEGEKKGLALACLAKLGSDRFPFFPIGLSGVWNWRGTIGKTLNAGGSRVNVKGVILDFDMIDWKGRNVIILFDSNVSTNHSVWIARQQLAHELTKLGAIVLIADLPGDCGVNGIDDFLGKIERERGTDAAVSEGIDLLKTAVTFGDARPIFTEEPRPLDQTLRPVEKINPDCLPRVLRNWLVPASRVIGCPLDFLVLSAITIAGSLIGARVRVKPIQNSNWFVVPNLYAGIVGLPSTKKSPALDEARKPLLRLQSAARELYKAAKADYDIEIKYIDRDGNDALKKSKSATEYRERLAAIPKTAKPTLRRFETNDATSQKMIQFLAENPNGLILTRDELTGWLKSLEAEYDQASRPFYLELWKGGISYDHARVSDNREVTLTSGTLSIIGGIQPSRLLHYISEAYSADNADGFPQRLLYAYPDAHRQSQRPTPSDFEQMESGLETACRFLNNLAEKQFNGHAVSDSGDKFLAVTFDADAQAVFDAWKDRNDAEAIRIESEDEVFASFLYKLPKSCAAIALIFHCLENINAGTFPDRISEETTVKTLGYIEVLTTNARRVFALGENLIFALANVLLGKIRTGKLEDGFTERDVRRKGWGGLKANEVIHEVLTLLVDYGYLTIVESGKPGKPGRPSLLYFIHPVIRVEVTDELE